MSFRRAVSSDFAERSALGVELAGRPHLDALTRDVLAILLLDATNTGVTADVAEALLARGDRAGVLLVVEALSLADELAGHWIEDAALGATQTEAPWTRLREHLSDISSTEPALHQAARRLLATLEP